MNQLSYRVLLLTKKNNEYAQRAAQFVIANFPGAIVFEGTREDRLPKDILEWKGDLLLSFVSSWILPAGLLQNAKVAAINFHPGPPEYPGIGCTNFAFYNGENEYGVTAHYMLPRVDSGSIIAVKRFPLKTDDTVYGVTQHCYQLLEEMFYEILERILHSKPLPVTDENWKRKPYTRKQLNELCEIRPDMSQEEIERRIKATTYKYPWAFIKIGERVFKLQP